jgi:aryl-alcohol dehydrogenase-like predicted oxidoreductase
LGYPIGRKSPNLRIFRVEVHHRGRGRQAEIAQCVFSSLLALGTPMVDLSMIHGDFTMTNGDFTV